MLNYLDIIVDTVIVIYFIIMCVIMLKTKEMTETICELGLGLLILMGIGDNIKNDKRLENTLTCTEVEINNKKIDLCLANKITCSINDDRIK